LIHALLALKESGSGGEIWNATGPSTCFHQTFGKLLPSREGEFIRRSGSVGKSRADKKQGVSVDRVPKSFVEIHFVYSGFKLSVASDQGNLMFLLYSLPRSSDTGTYG
jgi:hypothetical protein